MDAQVDESGVRHLAKLTQCGPLWKGRSSSLSAFFAERLHFGFQQLDPVAKRVLNIAALKSRQILIPSHRNACRLQVAQHCGHAANLERWVSLFGGLKLCLDTQMQTHRPALEPNASACGQNRRFGDQGEPEQPLIKCNCGGFLTCWNRKLDMM